MSTRQSHRPPPAPHHWPTLTRLAAIAMLTFVGACMLACIVVGVWP